MEQISDCPYCGKERHLYVNKEKGVFHCQRCKRGGRIRSINSRTLPSPNDRREQENINYSRSSVIIGQKAPLHWGLSERSRAYLEVKRKIAKGLLQNLPIFDTETGILFTFPGTSYWQVRQWSQFTPPRWLNPKGVSKPSYMVERVFMPTVWMVEGIVDALAVGEFAPAAAILSSCVTDKQAVELSKKYSNVVVMLDGTLDVTEEIIQKNVNKLSSLFKGRVWVERLPLNLDPATLDKQDLKERVYSYGW